MDYQKIWQEALEAGKVTIIGAPKFEFPCGGAYIRLPNFRDSFVKWLLKNEPKEISKSYQKGYDLSISKATKGWAGQSMRVYQNCAIAVITVLNKYGIEANLKTYID